MSRMFSLALAASTAEEQAEFLNDLGRYVKKLCAVAQGQADMQVVMIDEHIDEDGLWLVRKLAELRDA